MDREREARGRFLAAKDAKSAKGMEWGRGRKDEKDGEAWGILEMKVEGEGEQWNWRFCALLSWRRSPRYTKAEKAANR